ncbi:PAS domain-containing protein [Pseudomonas putida]|uniref:histidine kinase n=1 Tax=Pseudomonas putida TaxID=303 RepID=A0A2Z4RT87_PSEPU|nr:ATP-binding protein [Pseudomonas putida]AWY44269.1 PAS domain-containing protein [Pseudomonas putida]
MTPLTLKKSYLQIDTVALLVALSVACFVVLFKFVTDLSVATTVLYVTLVLMSANVFSIRIVIVVALACLFILTVIFIVDQDYLHTEAIGAYVRCIVSLSAITFLAVRSKLLSDTLRRNEAYLEGAQRLSQVGSVGFRVGRSELFWSAEAARIFEYPPHERPTMLKILERTHPEDRHLAESIFEQASNHVPRLEVEHRLVMPDGRIKHIHLIANPLETQHDGFEYLGAVMDVTAAKEAKNALFRSQSQLAHASRVTSLGELAASIAHEVNQPLAAIRTSGEAGLRWVDRSEPDLTEIRLSLDRMISASIRASEVIRRIRTLSRNCDPERRCESFNELVSDTLGLVQYELSRSHVKLRVELDVAVTYVSADRVQLQQVILNLIINACQAMTEIDPRSRILKIRTWVHCNEAMLEIRDCGVGITAQAMESLFKPFFTTKTEGLGMGLSICRSIIEFHDGRIWATSNELGGAVFSIALPVLENQP